MRPRTPWGRAPRARGAPVLQGPELALLGARPGGVRTRGVLANQLAA